VIKGLENHDYGFLQLDNYQQLKNSTNFIFRIDPKERGSKFLKMLVLVYKIIWHYNPLDCNRDSYYYANTESHSAIASHFKAS
jgi:hypothetical protein